METEEQIRKNVAKLTEEGLVGYIIDLQEEARSEGWSDGYDVGYDEGYSNGERVYY